VVTDTNVLPETMREAPEPSWTRPVVAIFSMVLFCIVLAYTLIVKDKDTMLLCVGAVISMATSAVNYYLGSSAGSARKTDLLAAAPAINPLP